jgi:hypothetical protein
MKTIGLDGWKVLEIGALVDKFGGVTDAQLI